MRRIDFRILIGAALIVLGGLMLLERFGGPFVGATDIFWGLLFLAGGAYFIYRFANNPRGEWWAIIPGSALVGIGFSAALPGWLGEWSGLFFLGFLGIGFLVVYITGRERWWAIIPAGILITLGIVSVLDNMSSMSGIETSGVFFLGLGLTFLLVAVLTSMEWAYIPGIILMLRGVVLGFTSYGGALNYIWPAALILVGVLLIVQFARRK